MSFTRPPTAQEAVLTALREAILTGELRPGEQVRQDQLADQWGVSRVPLREALKILEGEGQVIHHPHRGYFVAELSVADLVEVYRIRDLLEDEAVRVAVPALTDADLDRLEADLVDVERAGRAGDIAGITAANRRFHFRLYEISGMPRLVRSIRILWDATDVYRALYFSDEANRARVDHEHRAALTALRRRDADAAITVLADHRHHAAVVVSARLRTTP